MTISKINPEDISVLVRMLYLTGEVIIYDPQEKLEAAPFRRIMDVGTLLKHAKPQNICVNLSEQSLEILSFNFVLEFNRPKQEYRSFFSEQFLTIKNTDGTIRWFLPENSTNPNFLALYNGTGLKASVFGSLTKMAFKLGLKKWCCRNSFTLYAREEHYFQNQIGAPEFACFTGTIGENRKGVAAICEKGTATHFIKIPVSDRAKTLIFTEYQHLTALSEYDFKKLRLPSAKIMDNGLKLTNIRPKSPVPSAEINDLHLAALKDLYANTFQLKVFTNLDVYKNVQSNLSDIKASMAKGNDHQIPSQKAERLLYNIKVLLHALEGKEMTSVAYAHGDFTPWNLFVDKAQVHLYDWELAMPEQLLLYDAFHFIFQSGILIRRQSFQQIKTKIKALENNAIVEDIKERYRIDYQDCYHWYLISNCSYYLHLYLKQPVLHQQAHWLLDCWIEATNDAILCETKKSISLSTA